MGNFSEVGNFLLGILCLSFSLQKIEELAHRARKAKVVAKKNLTPVIHLHHLHINEVQFTAITIRESRIFCLTMVIKIVVTNSILFWWLLYWTQPFHFFNNSRQSLASLFIILTGTLNQCKKMFAWILLEKRLSSI